MNPMTNVKNVQKLNERELEAGLSTSSASWHRQYKDSAWIFIGGLGYDLTEGDIIVVFSQYGEIVNLNLVRDKISGKSKGFAFLCYEDQRSTILAVDNFNGIKLLGRTLRVDHCENYKQPKETGNEDEITKAVRSGGCGPDNDLSNSQTRSKSETTPPAPRKHKKHKRRNHEKRNDSDSDNERTTKIEKSSRKRKKSVSDSDRVKKLSRKRDKSKNTHKSQKYHRKSKHTSLT